MITRSTYGVEELFAQVKGQVGDHGVECLSRIYDFSRRRGDVIKWGPKTNKHAGFQIGFKGICRDPILFAYSDGALHFYTSKLDTASSVQKAFKSALEAYLASRLSVNSDNRSHYLIWFDNWGAHVDELLGKLPELLATKK